MREWEDAGFRAIVTAADIINSAEKKTKSDADDGVVTHG
jgi:hypothetical protein